MADDRTSPQPEQEKQPEQTIVLFPELVQLKMEVEKLRTEVSMLLLERDELILVECKNIETAYVLAFGGLEHKAFEWHCRVLRLKRKIELIQAKMNRQEHVNLSAVEQQLDEEFAEFKRQLEDQIHQMNEALEHSRAPALTPEEATELKHLYRLIVKQLHPDLHPDITPEQVKLLQNAITAYENGDLQRLRIISGMLTEPVAPISDENTMVNLKKEKERLIETIAAIHEKIAAVKESFPYNAKELLSDPKKMEEHKASLEELIEDLKEAYDYYTDKWKEMVG